MDNGAAILVAIVFVVIVASSALWVWHDARDRADAGNAVVVTIGTLEVDRPEQWTVLCALLWVLAFPAYLVARNANS